MFLLPCQFELQNAERVHGAGGQFHHVSEAEHTGSLVSFDPHKALRRDERHSIDRAPCLAQITFSGCAAATSASHPHLRRISRPCDLHMSHLQPGWFAN
jgi:hypothetical protein